MQNIHTGREKVKKKTKFVTCTIPDYRKSWAFEPVLDSQNNLKCILFDLTLFSANK